MPLALERRTRWLLEFLSNLLGGSLIHSDSVHQIFRHDFQGPSEVKSTLNNSRRDWWPEEGFTFTSEKAECLTKAGLFQLDGVEVQRNSGSSDVASRAVGRNSRGLTPRDGRSGCPNAVIVILKVPH